MVILQGFSLARVVLYIVKINQKKFFEIVLSFFLVTPLLYWCQRKKAQDKGRSDRKIEERKQARTKAEATKGERHHKAVRNSRGSIGKHR